MPLEVAAIAQGVRGSGFAGPLARRGLQGGPWQGAVGAQYFPVTPAMRRYQ